MRKLSVRIQPHPFSRDFSLTIQEAIDCSNKSIKAKPGWTKKDFSVSEGEEIKKKSESLKFFYHLKLAYNHPWMFHVFGDFVSSVLSIQNIDNSSSHLGSSSSL